MSTADQFITKEFIHKKTMEKEAQQQQSTQEMFKPYLKMEKSIRVEYQILLKMVQIVNDQKGMILSQAFTALFNSLSQEVKQLSAFEYLSYKMWLNDSFPASVRQKTRFFTLVFDWIVKFEMRVGKLMTYCAQFQLITQFIKSNTQTTFQRVVLLQQVYDDLQQLIPGSFWEERTINDIIQPIENQQDVTLQDAASIINFLEEVVFQQVIAIHLPDSSLQKQKENLYFHKSLSQLQLKNYTSFILNCIRLLLTTSNFDSVTQTNLTKVALKFLHRQLPPQQTIKIVKSLMVKTSKAVRYALVVQYVQFYEFLEKSNNYTVIEQLENSVYFRQLVIGRREVEEAEMMKHDLSCVERPIYVKARVKQRIYFSNESLLQTILRTEIFVQNGDISLKVLYLHEKQVKETTCSEENRISDTRIQLRLKHKGLYAVQFDNTYSWINGKNIVLKMGQFQKIVRLEEQQDQTKSNSQEATN